MRPISDIAVLVATVVAAALIGFGIPLLWVWIGSQLQGDSGATTLSFTVAVAILVGIIASYAAVLYAAGWLMTRLEPRAGEQRQRGTAREPWLRGMSDTKTAARGGSSMSPIERVFVVTTLIVTGAAWVWFLFFAEGGGLPSQ